MDFTVQWALRPALVRPAAGVVPGAQAPVRRHEDLAGGLPRHHRGRPSPRSARAPPTPTCLVSVAKSYVGEHAAPMLQRCVQLHGGIGVTWEHDLHLYLRRVTLYRSMFGTPEDHNLRVYALTEAIAERWSPPHDRDHVSADRPPRSVAEFAERARTWLAENMPRIDPTDPPDVDRGEDAPVAARTRTPEEALRGRLRGHLLPARVRRPGSAVSPTRGRSTTSRATTSCRSSSTRRRSRSARRRILDTGTEEQKRNAFGRDPR